MAATIISEEFFSEAFDQENTEVTLTIPSGTTFIVVAYSSYWDNPGASRADYIRLDPTGTPEDFTFVVQGNHKETDLDRNSSELWYLRTITRGSKTLRIHFPTADRRPDETVGIEVWYCSGVQAAGNPVEDSEGTGTVGNPVSVSVSLTHASTSIAFAHVYSFSTDPTGSGGTLSTEWSTGDNRAEARHNSGSANTTFEFTGADNPAMVAAAFFHEQGATHINTLRPRFFAPGIAR